MNVIYVTENTEENQKGPSETDFGSRSTNPVRRIKQSAISKLITLLIINYSESNCINE